MSDLEGLLDRLLEAGFDFVLVGGFAAVAHGATLVTRDVDVCGSLDDESLDRLKVAIGDLHPVHRMHSQPFPVDFEQCKRLGVKNLYLSTDIGPLDCLTEILGLGSQSVVRELSDAVSFHGRELRILSLDALIEAKTALDRPRDREAVVQLRALRERREEGR